MALKVNCRLYSKPPQVLDKISQGWASLELAFLQDSKLILDVEPLNFLCFGLTLHSISQEMLESFLIPDRVLVKRSTLSWRLTPQRLLASLQVVAVLPICRQ